MGMLTINLHDKNGVVYPIMIGERETRLDENDRPTVLVRRVTINTGEKTPLEGHILESDLGDLRRYLSFNL